MDELRGLAAGTRQERVDLLVDGRRSLGAAGLTGRRKFVIAGDPGDAPVFRMDFSDPTSAIDTLLAE